MNFWVVFVACVLANLIVYIFGLLMGLFVYSHTDNEIKEMKAKLAEFEEKLNIQA